MAIVTPEAIATSLVFVYNIIPMSFPPPIGLRKAGGDMGAHCTN